MTIQRLMEYLFYSELFLLVHFQNKDSINYEKYFSSTNLRCWFQTKIITNFNLKIYTIFIRLNFFTTIFYSDIFFSFLKLKERQTY